jgi:hypothetical protein
MNNALYRQIGKQSDEELEIDVHVRGVGNSKLPPIMADLERYCVSPQSHI